MYKKANMATRPDVQHLLDACTEYRKALFTVRLAVDGNYRDVINQALDWKPNVQDDN